MSISRQIGWSNESNLLYQILKQLTKLTGVIFNLTPKYKVYTALLTQSGGYDTQGQTSGSLVIGTTYRIIDSGGDFTNVGAPNNEGDTYFVATGTTPNNWGTGSLIYDTGAPVVTVLENTIGNIYWTYVLEGVGEANLTNGFPINKTVAFGTGTGLGDDNVINFDLTIGPDKIAIYTKDSSGSLVSNYGSPIEIRVYN